MPLALIPDVGDVEKAAERLENIAIRTPLLRNDALDHLLGGNIFIKPECLQRTGSFKFRGAYNFIARLMFESTDAEKNKRAGVVAYSSGNHAQGVAAAAQMAGFPATIIMPSDTPEIKVSNTKSYGAEVILYDRDRESREEIAGNIAEKKGAILIPPYDHADIIAGQGTAGLEIMEDMQAIGKTPDIVLICTGGGGLTAGCSLSIKAKNQDTEIYGVEPENFDDHRRSLAKDERVYNEKTSGSICDALMAPAPGELTFPINRQLLQNALVVSDDEVREAMR